MRRFEISEAAASGQPGGAALPALDIDDADVVIGSGPTARVRLPAQVAREAHVRIQRDGWIAIADVIVDGKPRLAGDAGPLGAGIVIELGSYRVRVTDSPRDAAASAPIRTESLARELVRGLLGAGAAPAFEQPATGARRELAPPEHALVIGRGDEAGWVILDEDLSREHAEIRRGWDGVTIRDLDSKNGTFVDGARIRDAVLLHDGAELVLGNTRLVFRDPAERHLRGEPAARTPARPPAPAPPRRSPLPFAIAIVIAVLAGAGMIWVLAS
ncbi:MAG TPA: FHA domain-containing protein [Kofleriaceae bacterium]|nr:FHA domain-containing protein [Kofleriaceae bacterium]